LCFKDSGYTLSTAIFDIQSSTLKIYLSNPHYENEDGLKPDDKLLKIAFKDIE